MLQVTAFYVFLFSVPYWENLITLKVLTDNTKTYVLPLVFFRNTHFSQAKQSKEQRWHETKSASRYTERLYRRSYFRNSFSCLARPQTWNVFSVYKLLFKQLLLKIPAENKRPWASTRFRKVSRVLTIITDNLGGSIQQKKANELGEKFI